MNAPKLIGIAAPGPGHGKSTLARSLVGHGHYQVRPFARPMKAMAEALLREVGLSWNAIDLALTEYKEDVLPELGCSMRFFLQRLGTEFGREQIREDFWIDIWRHGAERAMKDGMKVVVDDCRFENELEALREMGALMVYVERDDLPQPSWRHASDGGLRPERFDLILGGLGREELVRWGARIASGQIALEEAA